MNRNFIKILLATKIGLVIALAFWTKALFVTEKKGMAQAEGQQEETRKPEDAPREESAQVAQTESPEASILKGVLELPPLDPEKAKKEEIERYLKLVDQARQQIADREKTLESREKSLETVQATILKKLDGVENERNFFVQTVQREKDIQKERLDRLVTLYEKMEPKKAAPIIESMDKDLRLTKLQEEKNLVEIIELPSGGKNHPFFVGVQFHPEFQTRPLCPHPLFREFIKSALLH